MKKYRFLLLGLVHLPCSREYMACAFTQKNYKMAQMLLSLGHEVYYYGAEGSDVPCTKFIQTHSLDDIRKEWGDGDNRFEIGYDWKSGEFRHDFNSPKTKTYNKYVEACVSEINKIKKPDDFLLITQGSYQRPIDSRVKLYLTCEPGIGYRGSYAKFKAFESAYIQNFTYGSKHPFECINGNYYDRVIPNYFDDRDFEFSEKKEDYCLFIGRVILRKGIMTAYLAAKEAGIKLLIVGQSGKLQPDGSLQGDGFVLPKGNWEYLGFADVEKRKKLMSKARCTIVATDYLECFGGTHVESMLSGTPVLTTNFAVFGGDTFIDGVHGYKCNTLDDFVYAIKNVPNLDTRVIRNHAERFLMENVKWLYQRWFEDLYQLYLSTDGVTKGWRHIRTEDPEWRKKVNETK